MSEPQPDTPDTPAQNPFAALGLGTQLCSALQALGYEEPTPIQAEAIPPLLQGRDVVGEAATGTGKTAAFSLPLLQRLVDGPRTAGVQVVVLVPTRELAMQVAEAMHKYGRASGIGVVAIYGGGSMALQMSALRRGAQVVVATPGRALDHIRRGSLQLKNIRALVLDEADEMLDMGFAEDLAAILAETPATRQTALFSATMSPRILALAQKHLREPAHLRVAARPVGADETPRVKQLAYVVMRAHKLEALSRIMDVMEPPAAIVFCRTRTEVDQLTETLIARGLGAQALHGGMAQAQRDRVMRGFRGGGTSILVATDVAARGLDVSHVTHVVNYDVPSAPDAYVHRIGRTGRAGREGVALTLVEPRERHLLRIFERATRGRMEMGQVPTLTQIKASQLASLAEDLGEGIKAGGLDAYRTAVSSLAVEGGPSLLDVAAAAMKLAHDRMGGGAATSTMPDVLDVRPPPPRPAGAPPPRPAGGPGGRPWRNDGPRRTHDSRPHTPRPAAPTDAPVPRPAPAPAVAARAEERPAPAATPPAPRPHHKPAHEPPPRSEPVFEKKPYEKKPYDKKPFDKKPYDKKPYEKRSYDKKPDDAPARAPRAAEERAPPPRSAPAVEVEAGRVKKPRWKKGKPVAPADGGNKPFMRRGPAPTFGSGAPAKKSPPHAGKADRKSPSSGD